MSGILRVGELSGIGAAPFFFPLREVADDPGIELVSGNPENLVEWMEQGMLDAALVSPLLFANSPTEFLVIPEYGYGARRHVKDMLFFSDMLLDDMDEMTVSIQTGSTPVDMIVKLVLGRYLQYQNTFIDGWGSAEAFVLSGDAALRERMLQRYTYLYDVGDLWRHYTGLPMTYYLWAVRRESLRKKERGLESFKELLRQSHKIASRDFSHLAKLIHGYDWLQETMMLQIWDKVEYELQPAHFDGLLRFYEDCAEMGYIEDVPDLDFFGEPPD